MSEWRECESRYDCDEARNELSRLQERMAWQPIETAIGIARANDGWIPRCLFAIKREWGWAHWVGQCDAGEYWLGVDDNGACWDCERPTHWMPLPEPPH